MLQQIAWQITVILLIVLTIIFLFIFKKSKSRVDYAPIVEKAYRIRKIYFFALLLTLSVAMFFTLPKVPFAKPASNTDSAMVVDVNSIQFGWQLSANELPVGQPIEFRVTSKDVNHGFGIYNENKELIAQVQAMPDYTNKLYYTFTKPGKYQILCLEYCGIGHHVMIGSFEVKGSQQGGL